MSMLLPNKRYATELLNCQQGQNQTLWPLLNEIWAGFT